MSKYSADLVELLQSNTNIKEVYFTEDGHYHIHQPKGVQAITAVPASEIIGTDGSENTGDNSDAPKRSKKK